MENDLKCCCEKVSGYPVWDIDFSKETLDSIKTQKEFDDLSEDIRKKHHTMIENINHRYNGELKEASHLLDDFHDSVADFVFTKIASGELMLKDSYFKHVSQYPKAGTNIYYTHIKEVKSVTRHHIYVVMDSFECQDDKITQITFDNETSIEPSRFMYITQLTKDEFLQEVLNKAVDTIYKTMEIEKD